MISRIIILFIILISSSEAFARNGIAVQMVPFATLNSARFQINQDSTASFSGLSYGGYIAVKINDRESYSKNNYGLALVGGFESASLDNTANTTTEYETLESSIFNIGARFYALDLYLGLGVLYASATDTYVGSPSATTNYTGLGVRLESGFDLNLSKAIILTPRIYYDISDYSPETSVGSKQRFKNFGASLGIGLEF